MSARRPPLEGIRVIDLTTFLSGPFCTQILGDLGAEVIKIEPFSGDSSRSIPPHFIGEDSLYYLATNRNKRSIAMNLKMPEAQDLLRRLIGKSDVVIENFRPGVCRKLGLDADALRARHPQLIWSAISGFGQHGPMRDLPAYDMIVQALSGVMSMTGEPGGAAVRLGIPAGDLIAGMYAAIGILASLADRGRSGLGQSIDISMLDGQMSMLSYQGVYALNAGTTPQPQAARHDSIPTYRSFRAGDGRELVVTANTERMWVQLCEALGLGHLPCDERFLTAAARLAHKEPLWALLEPAFLARPSQDWVDDLSDRGVPAALIKSVPEAIADARRGEREMILELTDAQGRSASMLGNPIKLAGVAAPQAYPPGLNDDARAILRDLLGLSEADLAHHVASGAIMPV